MPDARGPGATAVHALLTRATGAWLVEAEIATPFFHSSQAPLQDQDYDLMSLSPTQALGRDLRAQSSLVQQATILASRGDVLSHVSWADLKSTGVTEVVLKVGSTQFETDVSGQSTRQLSQLTSSLFQDTSDFPGPYNCCRLRRNFPRRYIS